MGCKESRNKLLAQKVMKNMQARFMEPYFCIKKSYFKGNIG